MSSIYLFKVCFVIIIFQYTTASRVIDVKVGNTDHCQVPSNHSVLEEDSISLRLHSLYFELLVLHVYYPEPQDPRHKTHKFYRNKNKGISSLILRHYDLPPEISNVKQKFGNWTFLIDYESDTGTRRAVCSTIIIRDAHTPIRSRTDTYHTYYPQPSKTEAPTPIQKADLTDDTQPSGEDDSSGDSTTLVITLVIIAIAVIIILATITVSIVRKRRQRKYIRDAVNREWNRPTSGRNRLPNTPASPTELAPINETTYVNAPPPRDVASPSAPPPPYYEVINHGTKKKMPAPLPRGQHAIEKAPRKSVAELKGQFEGNSSTNHGTEIIIGEFLEALQKPKELRKILFEARKEGYHAEITNNQLIIDEAPQKMKEIRKELFEAQVKGCDPVIRNNQPIITYGAQPKPKELGEMLFEVRKEGYYAVITNNQLIIDEVPQKRKELRKILLALRKKGYNAVLRNNQLIINEAPQKPQELREMLFEATKEGHDAEIRNKQLIIYGQIPKTVEKEDLEFEGNSGMNHDVTAPRAPHHSSPPPPSEGNSKIKHDTIETKPQKQKSKPDLSKLKQKGVPVQINININDPRILMGNDSDDDN